MTEVCTSLLTRLHGSSTELKQHRWYKAFQSQPVDMPAYHLLFNRTFLAGVFAFSTEDELKSLSRVYPLPSPRSMYWHPGTANKEALFNLYLNPDTVMPTTTLPTKLSDESYWQLDSLKALIHRWLVPWIARPHAWIISPMSTWSRSLLLSVLLEHQPPPL